MFINSIKKKKLKHIDNFFMYILKVWVVNVAFQVEKLKAH